MRSNVYIKCREGVYSEIKDTLAVTANAINPTEIFDNGGEGEYHEYTLVWEWVKWYCGYPEVDTVEGILAKYGDSEDPRYGYRIIEICEEGGEDNRYNDSDIEMYVVRKVEFGKGEPTVW